jgi:hypothetical protein
MGVVDKMSHFASNVQDKMKSSSVFLFTLFVRLITGAFLGLTFSLILQELIGFGTFGFLFVSFVTMGLFVRASSTWSLLSVLVFDLFCVLVSLLLRMYILVAPNVGL